MHLKNLTALMLFGAGAIAAPFDKRTAEAEALAAIPPEELRDLPFGPNAGTPYKNIPYLPINTIPQMNRGGSSGIRPLPFTIPEKRAIPAEEARNLEFGPYGPDPFKDIPPHH